MHSATGNDRIGGESVFLKAVKILDRYIIRKFLGTFFLALSLIMAIAVLFDVSEKMDDFIERKAPLGAIIFDYYFNFIPYFANLFAPLFVFISVIFFTARMAANTEVVAILNSGVSFRRLLWPYFLTAAFLALLSYYFNGWVIPHSNKIKLAFENTYIKKPVEFRDRNIHRQVAPGEFIYLESYNNIYNTGYRFSMEKYVNGKRTFFLNSERVRWDSVSGKWSIEDYYIRTVNGYHETLRQGQRLDTVLPMKPSEFKYRLNIIEAMDNSALNAFIGEQQSQGVANVSAYQIEKYRRQALPFSTFILTLMGVALSSRKVRGGIGLQLGLGITLSFTYIMFMQISTTFATGGNLSPAIAVWLPNFFYAGLSLYLARVAPK
jgi:lipopolysaccharide export system permease protein